MLEALPLSRRTIQVEHQKLARATNERPSSRGSQRVWRIEITPARRWNGSSWVGHGTYYASYEGQRDPQGKPSRIGEWRVPECDAARWLRDNRGAHDSDILITHRPAEDGSTRGGLPCLRGSIGWFAERTVEENEKVSPRWAKHRPWSAPGGKSSPEGCGGSAVPSVAAEVAAGVQ